MLMYLTPIFYPAEIIPKKYINFIHLNPLLYYVNYFRDIIYLNKFPSFRLNLLCFAFGITAYIIGSYIFKKNENMFVLKV
jgi:ABC-type polysaccharide/polyol phosphate export permease